ncbi:hypothetical protein [Variovorax sp. E3]|uniref:hypothetical protein n=1 Tax=Variovorax sp. E3 TaxID=1914993 RepID=UPI0018DE0466|nr:hypothetical protein [Variovorax sp. E3]
MTLAKIRHAAGAGLLLAATALTAGCIVLPPPVLFHNPPPRFPGDEAPPMPPDARRPPMPRWNMCDGQLEGARPAVPGPRADAIAGSCERALSGALEFRPAGPR